MIRLVNNMTIKEKLKSMSLNDNDTRTINFCGIDWLISDEDLICIYKTKKDFNLNNSLITCQLKDIQNVDINLLNRDFSIFNLYRPNTLYNQIALIFILEPEIKVEKGIGLKIKYIN